MATSTPAPVPVRPARRWRNVAIGSAAVAAGVIAGLIVTAVGASNTGELALDVTISQHRIPGLTALALAINVIFGTTIAPLLLLATAVITWFRSRAAAAALALLTSAGWLSVEIGKLVVHRPRPPMDTVHALTPETAADSYPSGHTAFAAAAVFALVAALTLTRRRPRGTLLIGIPSIVAVGASRMYLGVHYLTDVVASTVFAGGTILAVYAITRPWLTRLDRESSLNTKPADHDQAREQPTPP